MARMINKHQDYLEKERIFLFNFQSFSSCTEGLKTFLQNGRHKVRKHLKACNACKNHVPDFQRPSSHILRDIEKSDST